MQLRWIANRSVSCLHAAEALAAGRASANSELASKLDVPVRQLVAKLSTGGVPLEAFWSHAVPLSAGLEANGELTKVALTKAVGSDRAAVVAGGVAAAILELKKTYSDALPTILDDLTLRSGPLREQWEARGPGLLAGIGRLTERELIAEQADVYPVDPLLGGDGVAHLAYNSVRIEAVLANPVQELPEVVRLGWLLSTLQIDLPKYSEQIRRDRVPLLARLAMLSPALEAAADVELVRPGPQMLSVALDTWHVSTVKPTAELAETVARWWETYREGRPPWHVALAALDKMLSG
jgi:hypothetical protein